MIDVEIVLDGQEIVKSCRIAGHAKAAKRGSDIVCAAVSVLARTIIPVFALRHDVTVRGSIPEHGDFWRDVEYAPEAKEYLLGAGAFFVEGLLSVSAEFPNYCKINIERRS
jgi:uncharacterized protein YsxB (DUF464 family)